MAGDEFVPEEWPICCLGQARTTTDLRCRDDPDLQATVIAIWKTGQIVDVWAKLRSGWWLVQERTSGITGWSWAEYLVMAR